MSVRPCVFAIQTSFMTDRAKNKLSCDTSPSPKSSPPGPNPKHKAIRSPIGPPLQFQESIGIWGLGLDNAVKLYNLNGLYRSSKKFIFQKIGRETDRYCEIHGSILEISQNLNARECYNRLDVETPGGRRIVLPPALTGSAGNSGWTRRCWP